MAEQLALTIEPTMRVDEFVAKWRNAALREHANSQTHFNDLCAVLGVAAPVVGDPSGESYTFEKHVDLPGGAGGRADVWKRGHFGWEYKSGGRSLDHAYQQLLGYREALGNPPILVVCDMNRFEIHTNFTNTTPRVIEFTLKELGENPTHYIKLLRDVVQNPDALHPNNDPRYITETAAEKFGEVADALRELGHDPNQVARFLNRLVFCFFAESMGLFRNDDSRVHRPVTITLEFLRGRVERSRSQLSAIFDAMSREEIPDFGPYPTPWFNGGLFDGSAAEETFPLTGDLVDILLETAELDWSRIEPAIFGTLFERGLDPSRRSQLGAHYTDPDNIMRVVEPVILRPLRREFNELRTAFESDATRVEESRLEYDTNGTLEMGEAAPNSPEGRIRAFHDRLAAVRVLDPACGSGNFLYVAMRELKQLEDDLISWADSAFAIKTLHRRIGPANMLGIDIDQFAVDLTRLSLWIGDIQWTLRHSLRRLPEPILGQINQIECRDAILAEDAEGNPTPAEWPEAEFIIGNPPFLGSNKMLNDLPDGYARKLQAAWTGRITGTADLCIYWHEQARFRIANASANRAGLLATNSIRDTQNRHVLERILDSGNIFAAYGDEPWTVDGETSVRISIVMQDDGTERTIQLDGNAVHAIDAKLTSGVDISRAAQLHENIGFAHQGGKKNGPFDIDAGVADTMLKAPLNVNGRPNSDVIFPFLGARDLGQVSRGKFLIDFGDATTMRSAAAFEKPFQYVAENVRPVREKLRNERLAQLWWLHESRRNEMRKAIAGLDRWIATPRHSKHRFFVWVAGGTIPDSALVVIVRDDDYAFGVLHSTIHEQWARATGSHIGKGNDLRYTHTTTFNAFPFPWPLRMPDSDLSDVQARHRDEIASAAASLHAQRDAWLNPPDADPDELKQRTITNLYNERPAWLDIAHREIDEAVFAAYDWPANLSEDEILARLLALNLARAEQ